MSTSAQSTFQFAPGQKLAGCYLLHKELAAGTEFPIWIAEDEVLGKEVALHFLPPPIAQDRAALDELRQEVKRNRPLIHPAVLRVYDLVEDPEWTAVATESFEGKSLAALLREKGALDAAEVESWLDDACVALEEAHRVRLTHRDLAPENLFVTPTGRLLVSNFGIGRIVQDALAKAQPQAEPTGRLSNVSPQMLAGEPPTASDDVYGLGALLFQVLTGQTVFAGSDIATKIRTTIPPRVSEVRASAGKTVAVPPSWENVIAACLNKQADERPHAASEIISSIEAYEPPASASGVAAAAPLIVDTPIVELPPAAPAPVFDEPAANPPELTIETPSASAEEEISIVAEPPLSLVVEPTPAIADFKFESELEPSSPPSVTEPTRGEPELVIASFDAPPAEQEPTNTLDRAEDLGSEEDARASLVSDSTPEEQEASTTRLNSMPDPDAPHSESEKPAAEQPRPARQTPAQTPHLYEEEDALSSILPKRFRFPAAVAAAAVLVIFLINNAFKDEKRPPARPVANLGANEQSELTSVKNSTRVEAAPEAIAPTIEQPKSAPGETLLAAAGTPRPATPIAVAPSPAAPTPAAAPAPIAEGPAAQKAAALEKLRAEIAAAEQAREAKRKEQQAAAAAAAEAQKSIEAKKKEVTSAKKATEELSAARKKRQDDQKKAENEAAAAQQLAAEKAQAAEMARKALEDFENQNKEKLAAQTKAETELQSLQQTVTEQQKTAEDLAKSIAAEEAALQQKTAMARQAEQEIQALQAEASKASEEAKRQQAMASEKRKLDDELAAMRALFEQKMKDLEERRRQIESGAAPTATAAPAPAVSAPATPAPMTKPSAEVKPALPAPALPVAAAALPVATPAATPIQMAKVEPLKPVTTPPPATPVAAVAPAAPVAAGGANSLGIRFVPVGDVQFAVWQTRLKDFEEFAKATNLRSTAWRGPGFRQGPDHPVVNVTWNEAVAFCKWLTDKEHKDGTLPANQFYRLPYDLEWSKAVGLPDESGKTAEARDMGVPDVYPWGTDWPPPKGAGNYTGEETGSDVAIKGYDDGFAWTSPVGSFPPNKFGLYDMGGNVWQWCMDSWNNESKSKVLRGASWYNGALKLSLLSSCRVQAAPDSSTDNYGFRIVKATEGIGAKPVKR